MTSRPETGTIKQGDTVYVVRSRNDMSRRDEDERYIRARVIKAPRVWLEIESDEGEQMFVRRWRIRRDTMDEGTQYSRNNAGLVTPAQYEWEVEQRRASKFLKSQGIGLDRGSPWEGREQELADLIGKAGQGVDSPTPLL